MATTSKPTQLSSSLVARKGQAVPAATAEAGTRVGSPSSNDETINAMTVKLDDARYLRLKRLGMRRPRRSSQAIMVAALDAYLDAEGA